MKKQECSARLQPLPIMADRIPRHQKQCMAKLTDRMLEKIAAADPKKSPTDPELRRIVAQRLKKMIPNFHAPVHATYAFMIRRAITELNSEAGSDKESISKFMKKEYGDLPLAHESLLRCHLTKLCEKEDISMTDCKRYMLRDMEEDGEPRLEKNGGGGCNGKGCVLKENEATEELQKVTVSSKHRNGRNQNGLLPGNRWLSRLQSRKPQEDETNEHRNELVDDVTETRGENDATGDQRYRAELSNTDHQSEYQLFDLCDVPYLKTKIGDEVQDISQQQKPNSAREGSSPNQKPDHETLAVATLSSQAPKPAAIESLSEPLSICDTINQKAPAPWNREVVPTRVPQQNSNFVSGSRSQDKDGTKKRKQIGRPPKIGENEHSGYNESLKVKRSRVKGCKSICYSDTSIIDLIYSQDHHNQVRPMSRFLGRAKKL